MYLSELFQKKKCVLSFEVFPPKKESNIDTIYNTLEDLQNLRPDFISVTYGAGGYAAGTNLTVDIATHMKENYGIEPLAHLTCVNSTREDVLHVLKLLKEHNICNVLALRGDRVPGSVTADFTYASELVELVSSAGGFNIAGACYPETHCESKSKIEDIKNLKIKVDSGVSHLISQLFFDNNAFFSFMEKARIAGISVPIQAGIMPVVNKNQIERIVSLCGASLPQKFVKIINRFEHNKDALRDAGIAYAVEQCVDLISNGAEGIHIYTMNNPYVARKITECIGGLIQCVNDE
ncbi:MAG: methylenetetrahydrofolate reductase [NAD(P)H] [Clostridiales bacterium]|nr:methylenetetrahydrofolate reductase [NAD(P)H] [Clostridiales bacterium]